MKTIAQETNKNANEKMGAITKLLEEMQQS
jgi:hypothetical protein